MRLVFYARDIGPFQDLQLVAQAARERGHEVVLIGNEPLGERNILDPAPDVLITGLSSEKNEEELTLGARAEVLGIPWVILADVPRSWGRQAARDRIGNAILLIGSTIEIEEAKAFGYQRVEYLGGSPKREKKWGLVPVALPGETPTVFAGGIKDPVITNEFLEAVVGGCKSALGSAWLLYLRAHPNEEGSKPDDKPEKREIYLREEERRKWILDGVNVASESRQKVPPSELLAISVTHAFFTSGATDSETAAMYRRRAYYYESPTVRARVKNQTGFETWFPVEVGALVKVTSAEEVAAAIRRLDSEAEFAKLNIRQAKAYPSPPIQTPSVEAQILQFLSELTGKPR